jgi:transglutaminase-like putative cysteine protease
MKLYNIRHRTLYKYGGISSLCHNEVRLTPNNTGTQRCLSSEIKIDPQPSSHCEFEDFFGNKVHAFSIQTPHDQLDIQVNSQVEVYEPTWLKAGDDNYAWDEVVKRLVVQEDADVRQFALPSPYISLPDEVLEYACKSFPEGRPLAQATLDLMQRIHTDFEFVSGFTTISTPLTELLKYRKGVCQDFAQLGIACLRSLGLPAGYVSGYIETIPPPGEERLVGADASHAWFAVHHPEAGWMEYDPTNNLQPGEQHITVGYGRDFGDISPVKGIMTGSGSHEIEVEVDVIPLDPKDANSMSTSTTLLWER